MKRILILLVQAFALVTFAVPAFADGPIAVTSNKFANQFPKQLSFQLEAQSSTGKITRVLLLTEIDGVSASGQQFPEFTPDTKIQATYDLNLQSNSTYLPPGVSGQYWWVIQTATGEELQTPKQPFRVEDLRRQWKKLENENVALYWDSGDNNFGKSLFDRGVQAISQLEKDTGVIVDQQVQIHVYGDRNDFLTALGPTASGKEGGVTFSNYLNGIVLENVPPSELEWGKSTTAHELTHVIMHQKIHSALGDSSFPTWLDEGFATYYETYPGELDPQFAVPLKQAIQNDSLYSIRTLSGYFNSTWGAGNLAYGEAYSIVDFILRYYGHDQVARLLQAIKNGGVFDDILTQVFGVDQDGLENEWRKDVGAKPRVIPTRASAAPTPFPTFGLSTDATWTPAPRGAASTSVPTTVAGVATAAPVPTAVPRAPGNPISQLCGGAFALIAVGIFGPLLYRRMRRFVP